MSQRTTTTCYALLLVLLVASFALVVTPVNTKNKKQMANTMPEDGDNNEVINKRLLTEESNELVYSRNYIAVTKAANYVTRYPNGGDTTDFLLNFADKKTSNPQFPIQGSSTIHKGDVFGSDSIQIVNDPEGVLVDVDGCRDLFRYQLAGNRKLRFEPMNNPAYFFHGQCIATSGFFEPAVRIKERFFQSELFVPQPVITSRSCQLNLCLGGGGFNCIAIYSGTAFVFNSGKGIILNNESIGSGDDPATFEAPPLPPPFSGTIIGGTGSFEGIEGSVDIATIAGTTGPILLDLDSPVRVLPPVGSIVQVISVKSNMSLPPGP